MFEHAVSYLDSSFDFLKTLDCYIGDVDWMIRELEEFNGNEERQIAALVCQNIQGWVNYDADYLRILYVLSGELELFIDGKHRNYSTGCLILASQWTKLEYRQISDNLEVVSFLFKKEYFDDSLYHMLPEDSLTTKFFVEHVKSLTKKSSYFVFQFDPAEDVHFFALLLLKQVVKMKYKHNYITKSAFALLLTEISTNTEKHLSLKDSSLSTNIMIHNIKLDLEKRFRTITLTDLAEKYSFHPNYLSALIKKETGKSFSALLLECRLRHACRYLRETELSVQEIVEETGYTDKTYFFAAFKKEYHMTPLQYRAENKKQ
jgi:AraC-like DNA-binding protein